MPIRQKEHVLKFIAHYLGFKSLSEHTFSKYRQLSNASQVFLLPGISTEEKPQAGILAKAKGTTFF